MFKLRYIFVVSFSIFYLIGNAQVLDDADGNVQDSIDIFQEVDAIAPLDSIIENTTDSINNEDLEIEPTDEFNNSVPNVEDGESSEDFDFYPIDEQEKDFESSTEDEFIFKPQVSLGTGMLTFYGDIGSNHQGYHPMVSRLATTLRLINPLNDFLDLGFYVLFGQISANERTLTRNLNFNSNITTGGVTINYNFNQFLRKGRNVEPYIHVGLESIEFLSKTDLQDANGNTYHYWSDGSIKDLAENDPNADNAIDLVRDYTYESDIREQNFDGFGKYQERTLGIPLELGANFHIGNKLKFRVGTAVHFTFTDLIDGVTNESVGIRIGDARNDKL